MKENKTNKKTFDLFICTKDWCINSSANYLNKAIRSHGFRLAFVPNSCVFVPKFWNQDVTVDSSNVKDWPFEHEVVKQSLLVKTNISPILQFTFSRNSSRVMDWVGLIAIIVGLNQKPSFLTQLIISISLICISFDHHSFVVFNSRNNKVNSTGNRSCSKASSSCQETLFFCENLLHQPQSRDIVLLQNTDEGLRAVPSMSGIHTDGKLSMMDSSEGKDSSSYCIFTEQLGSSSIVIDIADQFSQEFKHLEVPVPPMEDLAFIISHQNSSAGLDDCCKLIEKVEKDQFFKGNLGQLGHRIDFPHKVLVFEFVLGIPLYPFIEAFRNGDEFQELYEAVEAGIVIFDDWAPSYKRRVIYLYFVGCRGVAVDGTSPRDHCGSREQNQIADYHQQFHFHRNNYLINKLKTIKQY